jgi:hypothetical protein
MTSTSPTDGTTTQNIVPKAPNTYAFPQTQQHGGQFSQLQFRSSAYSRTNSSIAGLSPHLSRTGSMADSSVLQGTPMVSKTWFHSRRVKKGEYDKPWMAKKDPKQKWISIIPLIGVLLGICLAGVYVYFGIRTVEHHNYCPVLIEEFVSAELDTSVWTREVEVGGYG